MNGERFFKPVIALPVVGLVLFLLLAVAVHRHINAVASGTEITVKARGYDPRDLLLGHYVRIQPDLDYTVDTFDWSQVEIDVADTPSPSFYGDGWVVLERGTTYWTMTDASTSKPDSLSEDEVALRADLRIQPVWNSGEGVEARDLPVQLSATIDLDRFYANQKEALAIEDALRDQFGDDGPQVGLILSVSKDGTPRIKGVEIDGARNVVSWW